MRCHKILGCTISSGTKLKVYIFLSRNRIIALSNICVRQEDKEETDQRLGRIYVQDGSTGGVLTGCRMHDNSTGGEGTER